MAEPLNLSSLKPAQTQKTRKRIGRGLGSGKGRYSGRGIKGQKSRAGSHKMRAGFEGGQMPIYMRLGKQRGATSKDAMPIGPFRTYTVPVNVAALDSFDDGAEVTPEALVEKGLIKNTKTDVKLLGNGELKKKLPVRVHAISATARQKVEKAGGTVSLLKEPKVKKRRHKKPAAAAPEPKAEAPEAEAKEAKPKEAKPKEAKPTEAPEAAAEPEPEQAEEPAAPEES
jgi:large subunit ribosomal protein L15